MVLSLCCPLRGFCFGVGQQSDHMSASSICWGYSQTGVCGYLLLSLWQESVWSGMGLCWGCLQGVLGQEQLLKNAYWVGWVGLGRSAEECRRSVHCVIKGVGECSFHCLSTEGGVSGPVVAVRMWHLPALLFLKKSPKDLCPSKTCFEVSKWISFISQAVFKLLLLCCISAGCFVLLFL